MIDVKIGIFQIDGAAGSMIMQVSKDKKRVQGFVGNRVQKVFDGLKWNTTYVVDSLAGMFFPQNRSYNGNIGLLERNLVDMYFTPNSYNVLTRKIGLSRAVFASDLLIMQIVDPPKMQSRSDIVKIEVPFMFWFLVAISFLAAALLIAFLIIKSYMFISKLLNKTLKWKILIDILIAGIFYSASLFVEQWKSQDHSNSLHKFAIAILMIGIWLANRLFSGLMQTEAFRIDSSKIITSLHQTFFSDYQACVVANEPTTADFMESKLKLFARMFPTKPRHLYSTKSADVMNFMRNYQTRVYVATSIFIRSLSWSFCTFFKDEMGSRKIFSPKFVVDQTIAVFYYNLKADKQILDDIDKKLSVAVIEQSLSFYLRNPAQINLLENDVQNSCVVRNLKVFEDASYHSVNNSDHMIKFDSFFNCLRNYFIFITLILIIASIVYAINYVEMKRFKRRKNFLDNLGSPLTEEKLLDGPNSNRFILDKLYTEAKTVNEIVESSEFYANLNPFNNFIIKEEYQLTRLKYRKYKKKIEKKISEQFGNCQSPTKLDIDFENERQTEFRAALNDQRFLSNRVINFRNGNRLENHVKNSAYEVILGEKYLKSDFQRNDGSNTKQSKPSHFLCKVLPRHFSNQINSPEYADKFTGNDKHLFEYRQPRNLDLIIKKYNKPKRWT